MLINKFNPERFFRRSLVPFLRLPLQHPTRHKSQYILTRVTTNTPHPPRDPPENYNPHTINHSAFPAPTNVQPLVFRPLCKNDVLGPNASKDKVYKNPEYYAYHRFSHIDLFMNAMRIRMEKRMEHMCPTMAEAKPCEAEEAPCEAESETDTRCCEDEVKKDESGDCDTKPDKKPPGQPPVDRNKCK